MSSARIIYVYTSTDPKLAGAVRVASAPAPHALSPFLPPNCQTLRRIAGNRMKEGEGSAASRCTLRHCELSTYYDRTGAHEVKDSDIYSFLEEAGIRRAAPAGRPREHGWFICPVRTVTAAIGEAKAPAADAAPKDEKKTVKKERKGNTTGHGAADAMDWNEAIDLIRALLRDGRYRDCMLVSSGCFLGLRISDLLHLRWEDLLGRETFTMVEQKTGKRRSLKINAFLQKVTAKCHEALSIDDDSEYILCAAGSDGSEPITRQRADQLLKYCKEKYGLKSAKTFSTHSLRKTFGRQIWLAQCERGKGDQALILLCDVFGHSSVPITKRYLGIRQEEILSVYDTLTEKP